MNQNNALIYLTVPSFDQTGLVKHCFTTRKGGVSKDIYNALNTSVYKEDPRENVLENLKVVCRAVGVNYKNLTSTYQSHSDVVYVVTKKDIGRGIMRQGEGILADALITNIPSIPIITYYADCVPIYILDPINKAIGLIHSGWKGTLQNIAKKTLLKMKEHYSTNPEFCLIAIGPSLEQKCFEVDYDVAKRFIEEFGEGNEAIQKGENNKFYIDLWRINAEMLFDMGVRKEHITICGMCTKCEKDLFFSFRRDKGKTGSLSAIMELR